jgi:hypothetical protein
MIKYMGGCRMNSRSWTGWSKVRSLFVQIKSWKISAHQVELFWCWSADSTVEAAAAGGGQSPKCTTKTDSRDSWSTLPSPQWESRKSDWLSGSELQAIIKTLDLSFISILDLVKLTQGTTLSCGLHNPMLCGWKYQWLMLSSWMKRGYFDSSC